MIAGVPTSTLILLEMMWGMEKEFQLDQPLTASKPAKTQILANFTPTEMVGQEIVI